jgi:ATP-dependent RNA helicase RhlE
MKFQDYNIHPQIKRNLESMGFKRPTDIQYKCIPAILGGDDVLAIAQTGTGKTAAFAIPVLSVLNDDKRSKRAEGIKCLVMVPTHELASQIGEVFRELGKHTKVTSFSIFGGVDQDPQIEKLTRGVDVLIATPGRLFDLVSQKHLRLNDIEFLILDEADHMLDLGFLKDIQDLIKLLPRKRQTLFFSATIDEKIKKLAYSLVSKPVRIQISPKDPVSKNVDVDHSVTFIEMDDKRFFLERLIKEDPERKILVFVRTRVRAERVAKAMERVNIVTATIHGEKDQKDREAALKSFKEGQIKVLIATDVSARGIDISGIEMVINYDLPDVPPNYVHRVGRTGRGTKRGRAVSFCSNEEKPFLEAIENYTGNKIQVIDIDRNTYQETKDLSHQMGHDLQDMLKEIEELQRRQKNKFKGR